MSPGYDTPEEGCWRIILFIFGVLLVAAIIIYCTWPR